MGVTKSGRHYAKPTFKRWRDDAVRQIHPQLPFPWTAIAVPCNVRLDYVAGDKRRRDMPAVLDAVWHVLEKAGVVADDTLLWAVQSSRSYDKAAPGVTITFLD
jgi:Holliday junction resolvase RusA-like endonuclease